MVYVTWEDEDGVNVKDCFDINEAETFVKDNNLSDIADITGMDW